MHVDGSGRRPVILISACLAGLHTRYDGNSKPHPLLRELATACVLIPLCPEILGGLGIPRTPCRFSGGDGNSVVLGVARLVDRNGIDRTAEFLRGAEESLRVARLVEPNLIIFKEGSPSCGLHTVDIGGTKTAGCGVVTALFMGTGIPIISEEDPLPF
ncbi:MAG: DUF523 domain-containing protein [Desulfomonile tiedjei]|uniref:DUF523 domain-containing protein n=1 Tax=Desulfomonile tiedjei TaxID=2358 RepID=A0A9D6V272_9BACT|nr:DUF523 domain-containing protein [Desulfomonile tiedjei]